VEITLNSARSLILIKYSVRGVAGNLLAAGLKALDTDGRLEKRTNSRHLAKSGFGTKLHRSKKHRYSITSSARTRSNGPLTQISRKRQRGSWPTRSVSRHDRIILKLWIGDCWRSSLLRRRAARAGFTCSSAHLSKPTPPSKNDESIGATICRFQFQLARAHHKLLVVLTTAKVRPFQPTPAALSVLLLHVLYPKVLAIYRHYLHNLTDRVLPG